MAKDKKAVLVEVNLLARIIIDEDIDMDSDIEEVNKVITKEVKKLIENKGDFYIGEGIENYQLDVTNPYNPETDDTKA
jgi:hypothetical protein